MKHWPPRRRGSYPHSICFYGSDCVGGCVKRLDRLAVSIDHEEPQRGARAALV